MIYLIINTSKYLIITIFSASLDRIADKPTNQSCGHRSHCKNMPWKRKHNCCGRQHIPDLLFSKAAWVRSWFSLLLINKIHEWTYWCCYGWHNNELWKSLYKIKIFTKWFVDESVYAKDLYINLFSYLLQRLV